MAKAEAKLEDGTTVEVDFGAMEKRITENMKADLKPMFEEYMKQVKEWRDESRGKGIVEAFLPEENKAKLLEEFHKGEHLDPHKIQEQWTIAIPYQTSREVAAHLRDFCFVTDAVKGKVGDTVNIPYVKDLEFTHLTAGTGLIATPATGLVNVLTTTLHESGAYYDCYYSDLEKIDSNLLDELNRVMAHAAVRAEDYDLMALFDGGAATTDMFHTTPAGGASGNTWINCGDYNLAGSTMEIWWIADAIGKLLLKGKDVRPGELLLVLNPVPYACLLKKLATTTSTAIGYARPDVVTKGLVEDLLGVRIVVFGGVMRSDFASGIGGGATTYQVNFLMRPKRAMALAPKRDILIETDKLIAERRLRIVASHAYGVARLDCSEVVPIWSGLT